jgi:hypothetical protein
VEQSDEVARQTAGKIAACRMTDDLDLQNLRLPPGVDERRILPRKVQKQRRQFVKVPWPWVERLVGARHICTYRVALYLLHRDWKGGGRPFSLANGVLAEHGITRRQKWEALRELERLGLIQVERRPRKSPLVTVIMSAKLP